MTAAKNTTKNDVAATSADPRAAAIARVNREKAAFERAKKDAEAKRVAAKSAREAHEYHQLVLAEKAANAEFERITKFGDGELRDAEKTVKDLTPPEIAAAEEAVRLELSDIQYTLGMTYVNAPRVGTRAALENRRDSLERAKGQLEQLARTEVNVAPGLAAILDDVRLLVAPGEKPAFQPFRGVCY
jgi:hypothetical protein